MTVAVRLPLGIIAGGDSNHVLIGPSAKLGQAVDLHRAGVGDQDDLCPHKHQDPGALRKFPVVADHAGLCIQIRRMEALSRSQAALILEITGMDLRIGQHTFPMAVQ